MFAVTVLLEVDDRHLSEFMEAMRAQARNSLELEKDCRRFDICVDAGDRRRVFLYEIYTDKAAFDAHLKTGPFSGVRPAGERLAGFKKSGMLGTAGK